jgi:RNA polymerase sigma factor (sigma-70 family)
MEEDLYLIKKVKEYKDDESIQELINRHSGIYIEMVNRYIPDSIEGINKEDIIQDKCFCIYDAAMNFDQTKKTKFSTYVGNLARWKCLNIYNKNIKFPQSSIGEVFYEKISYNSDAAEVEDRENIKNIILAINQIIDKRARKIFKMRYNDGVKLTPWKKIAKKLDLSIQGCINIHNKHLTEIKKICTAKQY